MPRSFSPGHRPDSPLYPDETVYTTPAKVSEYLQLPLPDPVALAGDTVIATVLTVDYIRAMKEFINMVTDDPMWE